MEHDLKGIQPQYPYPAQFSSALSSHVAVYVCVRVYDFNNVEKDKFAMQAKISFPDVQAPPPPPPHAQKKENPICMVCACGCACVCVYV